MKNKTLGKSMQCDSHVNKLLLPFYMCLNVHAGVHLSAGRRLRVRHGVIGFLPPLR